MAIDLDDYSVEVTWNEISYISSGIFSVVWDMEHHVKGNTNMNKNKMVDKFVPVLCDSLAALKKVEDRLQEQYPELQKPQRAPKVTGNIIDLSNWWRK
jgi:hypothetical protein